MPWIASDHCPFAVLGPDIVSLECTDRTFKKISFQKSPKEIWVQRRDLKNGRIHCKPHPYFVICRCRSNSCMTTKNEKGRFLIQEIWYEIFSQAGKSVSNWIWGEQRVSPGLSWLFKTGTKTFRMDIELPKESWFWKSYPERKDDCSEAVKFGRTESDEDDVVR